jgi:haloalkane dehalogenase
MASTLDHVTTRAGRIAYRRSGHGPPLLLVHGWPFDGTTFDALEPFLAPAFTCYRPDTPGLGVTEWRADTDFRFAAQARWLLELADRLALDRFAILAHDTGATIARLAAAEAPPGRVTKMVLLDTEMPGHRPPWIPLYQYVAALPGAAAGFALSLRSRAFLRSSLGFGGCFHDPARLDDAFVARVVTPLVRSRARLDGALRYLRGIDWAAVDGLVGTHARIQADVLFVWGADDPVFPAPLARDLPRQLPRCAGLVEIPAACLLAHEERPREVAAATLPFLRAG